MDERNVPYIVHEGAMARMERTIKRLWILVILLAVFLVGTNAAWIYYKSQFETVETTEIFQDVDTGENGRAVITDGIHINGENPTGN
jgi:hypothetical protein